MSHTASRRGFIGSTLASLAAAPAVLAETEAAETPTGDATKAAIAKAVAECRQAAEAGRMDGEAAYGKALVARFGPGVVDTIRDTTVARAKHWLESAKLEKRDLAAVKAQLWDRIGPPFEWSLLEETPAKLRFEVRKCPLAEAMRRHGAPELGFAYHCAFDIGFCEGLNPAIRFTRTKTLMMGDTVCDHTYELPQAASAKGAGK